jgi:lipoate-protein ligase A
MSTRAGIVVDTGLRSGPENIRLDRAQWRAAQDAEIPVCHVRFHRYRPTVALGAFETAGHALRAEYCRDRGIAMVRRVSGGAAVYLDPEQLCWTLTLSRPAAWGEGNLADWLAGLCEAAASALQALGVDAVFVPPNDIEVAGRKLGSGFLALSDSALLFQGSLLLAHDTETMMKALRVPTEKLTPDGVRSARGRFATLREAGVDVALPALERHMLDAWTGLLGVEFGAKVEVMPEDMSVDEADTAPAGNREEELHSWYQSLVNTPGGVLYVCLRLSERGDTLQQAEFAGGVQLYPTHLFTSLSSWLVSTPVAWLDEHVDEFFRAYPHDLLGFTIEDLRHGLHLALDRYAQQAQFALTREQANTLMVHAPAPLAAADVANAASVMLLPYCAKPSWCKWRHRDGCPDCGLCEVSEAYRLAHERGMRVVTITDFEHLEKTLGELRAQGTRAYVGMCCRHCYLKREYAFRAAGIPAVLMDIAGPNCCELQQEDLAYAGEFQAQAYLDLEVLRKVMRRVPPVTQNTS